MEFPKIIPDPRRDWEIKEDHARADQYAEKGSVQHFMLRQGFMPHNEEDAEAILIRIIREREYLEEKWDSNTKS